MNHHNNKNSIFTTPALHPLPSLSKIGASHCLKISSNKIELLSLFLIAMIELTKGELCFVCSGGHHLISDQSKQSKHMVKVAEFFPFVIIMRLQMNYQ